MAKATSEAVQSAPVEMAAPAPVNTRVTEADMRSIRNATKAALDEQSKVHIRLPKAGKDEPNYETVCINGYIYQIKRGEDVMVPQAVRDILVEANII